MAQDQPVLRAGARERVASILLVGALSMFFAEVLSGSSVLWFLTPWGWFVTFWLYLAHTVLFVNLALRYGRMSPVSLYLWGVLFGLYEAWITKVIWAGYIGADPGWGTLAGFSFPELLIIVFIWHPVFSWSLPLLTFEVLGGPTGVLPQHRRLLVRTRRTIGLGALLATVGALFLAMNAHGDAGAVVVTIAGSVAVIWVFLRLAERAAGRPPTIESLRLGRRGMTLLASYLALLYGLGFLLIVPERIAPPLTVALTVGLYAVILLLVRAAGRDVPIPAPVAGPLVTRRDLGMGLIVLMALGIVFAVGLPVAYPFVVVAYLALIAAGPALLLWAAVTVTRRARAARRPA